MTFDQPCVVVLQCKAHPEMLGYVAVIDNSYFAVTEHDGRFTIKNVPPGTYMITAWSESLKPQGKTTVSVTAGQTTTATIRLAK